MTDDNKDHPERIPFKRAEEGQQKIAFKRAEDPAQTITNPDGTPLRDKDNAHPTLKPSFSTRPPQNLGPGGGMGIRTGLGARTPEPEDIRFLPEFEQSGLAVDHGIEVDSNLHTEGRLLSMPGYSFVLRIGDEPSPEGIGGGKIDQLILQKDGKTVASYNQGWKLEPKNAEEREALHRIRNGFDDTPAKTVTAPEHGIGKDQDIER